ncbi:MAG: molybdenum cofactor guanylyltransferase [Acidobacteriaceae bacterium]
MQAFLLAGGRSRRMGRDKASLELAGQPLVAHMLARLTGLGLDAAICGNRPDLAERATILPDPALPGDESPGPLAGILAGLEASSTALSLFLAVDMPGIPAAFLRWMTERAGLTQSPATIPFVAGRAQPLCAVYHCDLAPGIRRLLVSGEHRVFPVLMRTARRVDLFDVESILATGALDPVPAGPPQDWFRNLNTPREFALYAARHPSNKVE